MDYEEIQDYIQKLLGEEDEPLKWADNESDRLREEGVYQIDRVSGRFIELLAEVKSARRVLEIGSGAGYSALWFMKGMPKDGTLDAIELSPKVVKSLRATVRKAGLVSRIRIHQGRALDILPGLKGSYDIVFIDADKDTYPQYLDYALRLTQPGSLILADDVLKDSTTGGRDKSSVRTGIAEYTKRIFSDELLSSLIVPVGDGIAVSYRIK